MLFSLRRNNDVTSIVAWTICSNSIPRVFESEEIWTRSADDRKVSQGRLFPLLRILSFCSEFMASEQQENFIKSVETLTKVFHAIAFFPSISRARKSINNMKILLWKKRFLCRVVLKAFFSFFSLHNPFRSPFFIGDVFAEDLEYLWKIMFSTGFHILAMKIERHCRPTTESSLKLYLWCREEWCWEAFSTVKKRRRNRRRRSCSKLYQVSLSCLNIQVRSDKMKLVESGSW